VFVGAVFSTGLSTGLVHTNPDVGAGFKGIQGYSFKLFGDS